MGPSSGGTAVIIPARMLSSRFPGKLLHEVAGRSLLEWTYRRALAARGPAGVWIATDSPEIAQVAARFGASVIHTGDHPSGSDRVAAAANLLWPKPRAVINVQGDEPLIDPELISRVCAALETPGEVPGEAPGGRPGEAPGERRGAEPEIVTCAAPFTGEAAWRDPSVVKVVTGANGRALLFSRAPIPYSRDRAPEDQFAAVRDHVRAHIGLYGYPLDLLQRVVAAPPSSLEKLESLEQLRALEMGVPIRVLKVPAASAGVDTPADLERVRPVLERERAAEESGSRERAAKEGDGPSTGNGRP